VADVRGNPLLYNDDKFVVKLPYAAGGVVGDSSAVKYTKNGVDGIIKAIRQFLRNHRFVLGYIPYVIVQPRFANNAEVKVIIFYNLSMIIISCQYMLLICYHNYAGAVF
jgi:hypothetical protein